ncbi:MAG: exosortase [Geobacter sp.]|nr:exosortase [Geobacter sp.]
MTVAEFLRSYRLQFIGVLLSLAVLYSPIVPSMVQWWYQDDNYSHGFIVPLIAGYFLYCRREELLNAKVEPWWPGLLVLLAGLFQLLAGWLAWEYFTMRSSLITVIAGILLFVLGRRPFLILLLPVAYLLFMVPIPYIVYDAFAFPLKMFVTKVSVDFLQSIGVIVMREGNILMFPSTTLEVADACSGIRSIMSLLALSVAYGFFLKVSPLKRLIIALSALPIAIVTNALRVIITGILAQWWGAKAAEGFFHEFAGLAVFGVAIVLLVGLGALLGRERKES